MLTHLSKTLAATLIAAACAGSAAHAAEFKMKLATATVNDVQTVAIKRFAERIEKRSNGRIKTELYPAAQLGSNARMIEGLQFGTIEFYTGPTAYLVGVDARYQITDAPGVFRDARHAQKVFDDPEFEKQFLAIGESKGIVGLGTYMYGNTAFATAFPGAAVKDFDGKKVRVMASKVERRTAELLGVTAVPIDFSEVVTALQQGTIDGLKSAPPAFTSLKLFNIVKHVTATEEGVMGEIMAVSKAWFDKLPADLQTILREEAVALEPELWDFVLEDQANAYKKWEAEGGTVHRLNEQERAKLIAGMREAAVEQLGSDRKTKDMFNLMLKTAEKY